MRVDSRVKEDKPILKGSNLGNGDLFGAILIIILITIASLIVNVYFGVIVFIILFLALSRFHYRVHFYNDAFYVENPLYFRRPKFKRFIYSDIQLFTYNPIALIASPFAVIDMKSDFKSVEKIKFNWLAIDSYMKKLIAVLENYDVPIEGIDMKKYGTKK